MDKILKQQIVNLVAEAKTKDALSAFKNWASSNNADDLLIQITLLSGQLSKLTRDENLGLLDFKDSNRTRAQINNALLELLETIDTKDTAEAVVVGGDDDEKKTLVAEKTVHKILFLASNPTNTAALKLKDEYINISGSLQDSDSFFELYHKFAATPTDLQTTILKYKPSILHFSGHGIGTQMKDTVDTEGGHRIAIVTTKSAAEKPPSGILLQDAAGKPKLVEGKYLANVFGIFAKYGVKIDVVFLNACYSGEQAKIIGQYVDYVIGMNDSVLDNTALAFATQFYTTLGLENNVEMAFDLAKNALALEGLKDEDVPILYKKGTF